jgi:hypothetical protein
LKNAPPQFSKRKSLANKLFEDMQSCEVRQWQTFLQLRKKYVYIYISFGNIWQVKFLSAGKNIHVVVNHEDLAGGAL